ncbi:anti-sigma factor [Marivirga lumbricoides]|uniref:Anti-sigma factor n=1 Tax=Marivirga lumbricoides TaxID=1046115 RepID=A0ABQ1M2R3_9BACT|nr:anti-sigma factor [Marivirga lumbricoides]
MKIDYSDFNENDFAADENFQQWVLSPNEENNSYWQAWLIENPERRSYIEEARELVLLMEFKPTYLSESEIEKMRMGYKNSIRKSNTILKIWNFNSFIKIIAAVALLFVTVYILQDWYHQQRQYESYQVKNGLKLQIILPDGSKVWLNGGSTLTHRKHFETGTDKIVTFTGEAFFDVNDAADGEFEVRTNNIIIKSNKAAFNVQNYSEDENAIITVVSGKVFFRQNNALDKPELTLKEGDQLSFYKNTQKTKVSPANLLKESSWKEGKLVIEKERLKVVAKKLERWYGAEIQVKSGEACLVSCTIENETLDTVFLLLEKKFSLNRKQDAGKFILEMECE